MRLAGRCSHGSQHISQLPYGGPSKVLALALQFPLDGIFVHTLDFTIYARHSEWI